MARTLKVPKLFLFFLFNFLYFYFGHEIFLLATILGFQVKVRPWSLTFQKR